jgi:hypothetical protein
MRFFRVNLPKKYRSEDHADELVQTACSMKVFVKTLISFIHFFIFQIDQSKKIKTV